MKLSALFSDKLKLQAVVLKPQQVIGQALFRQTDLTILSLTSLFFILAGEGEEEGGGDAEQVKR